MPARLNHNVSLKQVHHNMRLHFGNVGTQIEKAASGMRVNRSSDDPASLALANSIDAEVKALAEGGRNVQQSVHMLQVAEGAMAQIAEIVQRMQELATQSATSTYNDNNRSGINTEFQQLKREIDRIAESTTYNGNILLDSERDFTIQTGPADASNNVAVIAFGNMRASGPRLKLDSITIETRPQSQAALDHLHDVHNQLVESRNQIAAFQHRLEQSATTTSSIIERMRSTEGSVRDADIAQTLTNLTRSQILAQTAGSLAQEADIDIDRILQLMR